MWAVDVGFSLIQVEVESVEAASLAKPAYGDGRATVGSLVEIVKSL